MRLALEIVAALLLALLIIDRIQDYRLTRAVQEIEIEMPQALKPSSVDASAEKDSSRHACEVKNAKGEVFRC